MVEQTAITFDSLVQEKTDPTTEDIQKRQQTCKLEDIPQEERPEPDSFIPKQLSEGRRQTIRDIQDLDPEDFDLMMYKQNLLGELDDEGDPSKLIASLVHFIKIELVPQEQPDKSVDITPQLNSDGKLIVNDINLRQNTLYNMKVTFRVKNDIVSGLKLVFLIKKTGINVDKIEQVMGSFAPKKQEHQILLDGLETPGGFFKRGTYKAKCLFCDMDGNVHLQETFGVQIQKSW